MTPPHRPARRAVLLVLLAAGAVAACAGAPRTGAAPPPVRLVESRPVDYALGDPAIPATLDTWLGLIRGARTSLDIEQFYVSTWPDEPLEEVLAALGEAARRGVRVRLLLDARMHGTYPLPADSLARLPGFAVRLVDFRRLAGGVQHAKFFLVDGETVFLGSQNFDWRALQHIHELGVAVRDRRVAADFGRVFELDWAAATPAGQAPDTTRAAVAPQSPHPAGTLPYAIVQAPGDTLWLWPSWSPRGFVPDTTLWDLDRLVRVLDGARHEVVVQFLSYGLGERRLADDTLDRALRRAAARGARVRVIVSDWQAGAGLAALQRLARVPGIEVKRSTVPEWSGGYIPFARVEHCKYVVADTLTTWVGTSNWSPDYFHASRNLAVTMRNRPLARQARAVFETSWRAPGAAPLVPDSTYTPKSRGEETPPGRVRYGG